MMWVAQAPHLLRRGLISLCALLSCALLCACAPPHLSDEGSPAAAPALEEHSAAVSLPGNWLPPPDVLAIGDRISVRRDAEPTIAPQGSCDTPNNPWTCSCEHPACQPALPGTLALQDHLRRQFPQIRFISGSDTCCRQNSSNLTKLSVHSLGRALDIHIREVSPGVADNTLGDPVANWLLANAAEIGVQYIAWDRAQWSTTPPPGSRLRAFNGSIPHTDHIHAELNLDGANRRTPFFMSGLVGQNQSCSARCDGSLIIDAQCNVGDCAHYGTTCIADPTPRCGTPECPRTGSATICLDEGRILGCNNGVMTGPPGDCGAFGSYCSTAGVAPTAARCVLSLCVDAYTPPYDHETCSITAGQRLACFANNTFQEVPCPAGQVCTVEGGGGRCVQPIAGCPVPPAGQVIDQPICLPSGAVGRCFNGNIVTVTECDNGSTCSASGDGPHCALRACLNAQGRPVAGPACASPYELVTCDAVGSVVGSEPCLNGALCEGALGSARCVAPPPPPPPPPPPVGGSQAGGAQAGGAQAGGAQSGGELGLGETGLTGDVVVGVSGQMSPVMEPPAASGGDAAPAQLPAQTTLGSSDGEGAAVGGSACGVMWGARGRGVGSRGDLPLWLASLALLGLGLRRARAFG